MDVSELKKSEPGKVNWDILRTELLDMPKETLVEMVNDWLKTYWDLQGYWMILTEKVSGFDMACDLDIKIWERVGPIQAKRAKRTLGLGDDIQSLATIFKFTAPQWVSAGFEWEITEITDKKLVMTINHCPMETYRNSQNLELLPCKLGNPSIYEVVSKAINEKFVTTCLHAHPDPPEEGVMCRWECKLED